MGMFFHDMYGFDTTGWHVQRYLSFKNEKDMWAYTNAEKENAEYMKYFGERAKPLPQKIQELKTFVLSLDENAMRGKYGPEDFVGVCDINTLLYEVDRLEFSIPSLVSGPMANVFQHERKELDDRTLTLSARRYWTERGKYNLTTAEFKAECEDILAKTRAMRAQVVGNAKYSSVMRDDIYQDNADTMNLIYDRIDSFTNRLINGLEDGPAKDGFRERWNHISFVKSDSLSRRRASMSDEDFRRESQKMLDDIKALRDEIIKSITK